MKAVLLHVPDDSAEHVARLMGAALTLNGYRTNKPQVIDVPTWDGIALAALEAAEHHSDIVDCTCDDPDVSPTNCWYRLTPREQLEECADYVAFVLAAKFGPAVPSEQETPQ